jgi:hypothetical protein
MSTQVPLEKIIKRGKIYNERKKSPRSLSLTEVQT